MKISAYVYIMIGALVVSAELTHDRPLMYILKPLLMPALILFYIQSLGRTLRKIDWLLIAAWAFSWFGDVVLMFSGINYFLAGLVGFLITHLLYTGAFNMVRDRSVIPLLKRKIWLLIPLVAYLVGLMWVVFPAIGDEMRPPIAIYSIVIGVMVISALNRYGRVNDSSFALVFGGALIFMLSDSLIAVNKFLCHDSLYMAGVWIMSTYMVGQYLIAMGMLKNETAD